MRAMQVVVGINLNGRDAMEKIKTKDLRELETRLESRLRTVEIR